MYFALGSKKTDFWPAGGDLVDFAVRRRGHVEIVVFVERQSLCGELFGLEHRGHFPGGIDSQNFGILPPRGVEVSFGVHAQRPEVGEIRVGKRREFGRQHDLAIATQGHAVRGAVVEILKGRLAPETGVFGESRRGPAAGSAKRPSAAAMAFMEPWLEAAAGFMRSFCA